MFEWIKKNINKFKKKYQKIEENEDLLKRCEVCHQHEEKIYRTKCCNKYFHKKCYNNMYNFYNIKPCC